MEHPNYVTISRASALAGIPEQILRQWIETGAVASEAGNGGEQLVCLEQVRSLGEAFARLPNSPAPPEHDSGALSGAIVDHAPAPLRPRPDGLALVGALVTALVAKFDALYSDVLAAKDDQLAAKDDLIAELRRRVEQAEQEPADGQQEQAEPVPADEQPEAAVSAPVNAAHQARRSRSRPLLYGAVAVAVALILLSAGLSHLLGATSPEQVRHATHTSHPPALLAIPGVPLVAKRMFGDTIGLLAPRAAVALANGDIAVADTGNHRLAVLDAAGRLIRSERGGGLRQPVAIAATHAAIYVLDARRGAIESYDLGGHFMREVLRSRALRGASGMVMGRHSVLYVANPRLRSVIMLAATTGRLRGHITTPRGLGHGALFRPFDVTMEDNGTMVVFDGAQRRILALSPSGAILARWPAPAAVSPGDARLLALRDGRLLVTDPTGAVLVYAADSSLPVFLRHLSLPARQGRVAGPLSLSRLPQGDLLVTDTSDNRLLIVPLPS